VPTWDSDRPKGNRPANEVDDTVSENFEAIEEAFQAHSEFPGVDGTSRGRFKLPHVTVAAADALSDLADGHIALLKNLGGSSQDDGDGAAHHFWPARYSAAGGSNQHNAFAKFALPVADDATDESNIGALLTSRDLGFPLYRKHASGLYVPKLWTGAAFVDPYACSQYEYEKQTRSTVGSGIFVAGSWNPFNAASTITCVTPATGNWRLMVRAKLVMRQGADAQGYRQAARLFETGGSTVLDVSIAEWDTATDENGFTYTHWLGYSANAVNGTTYTVELEGAAADGSGNAQAADCNRTQTIGGGAVTTTSWLEGWLELRP
jgi:hypothetical protein